jgi:hypothetical protein
MRGLRVLCAALLFLAFTLGVPLHAATAHGTLSVGVPTSHATHVHENGATKCCDDHHGKAGSGALCQMVCAAAIAVLDTHPLGLGTQLAYAVQFASGPPMAGNGVTLTLDPFPPRPSPIA